MLSAMKSKCMLCQKKNKLESVSGGQHEQQREKIRMSAKANAFKTETPLNVLITNANYIHARQEY